MNRQKNCYTESNNCMKIFVEAKPGAREEKVEKIDPPAGRAEEHHFIVAVKEPPIKGRANHAIAQALARYFNIPRSCVNMVSGFASRNKRFEITT